MEVFPKLINGLRPRKVQDQRPKRTSEGPLALIRRSSRHRGLQFGISSGSSKNGDFDSGSFKINLKRATLATELDEIEDNFMGEESSQES